MLDENPEGIPFNRNQAEHSQSYHLEASQPLRLGRSSSRSSKEESYYQAPHSLGKEKDSDKPWMKGRAGRKSDVRTVDGKPHSLASVSGTRQSGQKPRSLNPFGTAVPGTGSLRTGHSLAQPRQSGDPGWLLQHRGLFVTWSLGPRTAFLARILPVNSHSALPSHPAVRGARYSSMPEGTGAPMCPSITSSHGA